MPREEAVRLVQMAERMRQGRLRARFMWEIRRDEEREKRVREGGIIEPNRDLAATCIQRVSGRGAAAAARGPRARATPSCPAGGAVGLQAGAFAVQSVKLIRRPPAAQG